MIIALLPFNVSAADATYVNYFKWTPANIYSGQSTSFSWDVRNVTNCTSTVSGAQPNKGILGPYTIASPGVSTTNWYCTGLDGKRFPETGYLTAKRTTVDAPKPYVNYFKWTPANIYSGQSTSFSWDVKNVTNCTSTVSGVQPKKGTLGPYTIASPGVSTTQWFCTGLDGKRFPETGYLTAKRTTTERSLPPSTPIITLADESENGYYDVKWNAVSGATSYKLYDGNNTLLFGGSANKYSRERMPTGKYTYKVSACNAAGCSGTSAVATILVLLADNTIGSIDNDGNGIRDDIELRIAQLAPVGSLKNGYLKHTAFYTRAFLQSTDKVNNTRYFSEIIKGQACLLPLSNGEEAYATIMGNNLDSKERFSRYTKNSNNVNEELLRGNNAICVLKGTGVEPVSGCYEEYSFQGGVHVETYHDNLLIGENVKLTINVKNLPEWGGTFDFSYFLNNVLQHKKAMANEEQSSWVINNYNYNNDGYLKLLANNPSESTLFEWSITCESNQ